MLSSYSAWSDSYLVPAAGGNKRSAENTETTIITGHERRRRPSEQDGIGADSLDPPPSPSGDTVRARSPPGNPSHTPAVQPTPLVSSPHPPTHAHPSRATISSSPSTPTLEDLDIGVELRAELLALPPDERDREISILAGLQPLDRERASNFARNRVIMGSLGLSSTELKKAMGMKMGQNASHGKRANSKGKGIPGKRASRGFPIDNDTDSSSSDTDTSNDRSAVDSDDGGTGESANRDHENKNLADEDNTISDGAPSGVNVDRARVQSPRNTQVRSTAGRATVSGCVQSRVAATSDLSTSAHVLTPALVPPAPALDRMRWPAWMTEAYDFLSGYELNEDFATAILWWTAVERAYHFKTSVRDSRAASY